MIRYEQYQRALADDGAFQKRYMLLPFEVTDPKGRKVASAAGDEGVFTTTADGLAELRSVMPEGTVTFGSQTHPADGSCAMIVAGRDRARELARGKGPEIRLVAYGQGGAKKGFMAKATVPAARGFRAAEEAFRDGATEMEVHHSFLAAAGVMEASLPYPTIIGFGERSATLHYHGKRGTWAAPGRTLLVDAGVAVRGYGCDITRTFAGEGCDPVFCSGTWIAHGSGEADRQVVQDGDRIAMPPGQREYWLRRIWLTAEEESGYYYGFANEGMWPLCHVAHVRPVFRESDWEAYRLINQRFADAVVAEACSEDPVVLVQDYHFALVPGIIRERLPQATILMFWHIPWPNPESFGICPWRREILQGMLGSTILGFHTRFHCKNFIETVDRYLEARIEHEHSTIAYQEKETLVESYPISIEWPSQDETASWAPPAECRRRVIERLGLPSEPWVFLYASRK